MTYDNTNSGALFKNDRKTEGDKLPDYRGELDVDGRKLEIAAWIRTSAKGTKFMSLKVQEPHQKQGVGSVIGGGINRDLDDEIPF